MPCKDSSALMTVRLDAEDRLRDYAFNKITCSRDIGGGRGYQEFCAGKGVQEILDIDFPGLIETLHLTDTEEQFLVYSCNTRGSTKAPTRNATRSRPSITMKRRRWRSASSFTLPRKCPKKSSPAIPGRARKAGFNHSSPHKRTGRT